MNYKESAVRVVSANGRFCIESRVGATWYLVALRERHDTAQAVAAGVRAALSHTDDRYEAEARLLVDTASLGGKITDPSQD